MELNWKKGDFEVRTTQVLDGEPYVELIKWQTDGLGRRYCFTLAYFRKSKEGNVSLCFVNDRPFEELAEIDINSIWKELFLTEKILEERNIDNGYE